MTNIIFDFLHNYQRGERRESEPATVYQYDEGHVLEAILPEVITSVEIHYWIRGMEEAEAYTPSSITANDDGSCTVLGNIPNKFFETDGDLRVYIVVNDAEASITTYEGKIHAVHRAMPDDYVDDDPENEATRILTEAQAAATTATQQAQAASTSAGQAQQSAQTLSQSVEQIATNTQDITALKEDLYWQNEVALAEASPTNYTFVIGGLNGADGAENTSTARAKTDYIPYLNDELIVEADDDYLVSIHYYDENKTWLIAHWWYGTHYNIKGYSRAEIQKTKYVRVVLKRADDGNINISDANAKVKIGKKGDYPRIYTVKQDGTGDFNSLVDAITVAEDHMDSTLFIGEGTWDIISDLGSAYVETISASNRGIYLKNRITLNFSSKSKVICNYTGNNSNVRKWLSVFNTGAYGFTLNNAVLEASNVRYVVHDERDSDADIYFNNYINCVMSLDNSGNTETVANQCIGGGLGQNGHINIEGGSYTSVGRLSDAKGSASISYHNSASAFAQNKIDIHNAYIAGFLRFNYYGASTAITQVSVSGCSFASAIACGAETQDSTNVNVVVKEWDNINRTKDSAGTYNMVVGSADSNFTSLIAVDGMAIFTFLLTGINLTTSNQHLATLSFKPKARTMVVIYDKASGSIAEGYVDLDGKFYSKAYAPLTDTNLRGCCVYAIA